VGSIASMCHNLIVPSALPVASQRRSTENDAAHVRRIDLGDGRRSKGAAGETGHGGRGRVVSEPVELPDSGSVCARSLPRRWPTRIGGRHRVHRSGDRPLRSAHGFPEGA
jgi:hypothetical protein